ncbi:MAG TPA: 2-C-methyl-D-erythritol 4-phosphate cytidylyltransferase [Salinibacter sp.]|nr:2-C-methyl-D-erythritol 4-phosphate cytidylyltransferase [Salinibacter sp.]
MADTRDTGEANEVAVLVPAAGEGSRLGGVRKQFRTLGDRPLLVQVLLVFERHPTVGHLVVAVPEDHVREVSDRLQSEGLSKLTAVVSGGDARQSSVRNALRAVPAPVEVVLVHDAVRPFVQTQEVQRVIDAARTHGAASLAMPVADTLREAEDNTFGETVPRDGLYRMQTPQGFRRAWLEEAHRQAAEADGTLATDDVGLVQRAGRSVHCVQGHRRNFKITTKGDWTLAQQLWGPWTNDPSRTAMA